MDTQEQFVGPPGSVNQNFFYDHINSHVYEVKKGNLYRKDLLTDKSSQVDTLLHTCLNENIALPKLQCIQGQAYFNLEKAIVASKSSERTVVRSSLCLSEHCEWTWYIPSSLNEVKIGLVQQNSHEQKFTQIIFDLNSSTSRTVTCRMQDDTVRIWVNGTKPGKCHQKKIQKSLTYFPAVFFAEKGFSAIFSPFADIPNEKVSYLVQKSKTELQENSRIEQQIPIKSVHHLSENKLALVGQKQGVSWVKVVHRNHTTGQFQFPTVNISKDNVIKNLINQDTLSSLQKHASLAQIWSQVKNAESIESKVIYSVLQQSLKKLQIQDREYESNTFKTLLQKLLILRSQSSLFNTCNPIFQNEIDRQSYLQSLEYFGFPKNPALNVSKERILNQQAATKIQGQIIHFSENYFLSLNEQTVSIHHVGDRIKEVFKENMIFFELNKTSFLKSFDEGILNTLSNKEALSSSIYKLLSDCCSQNSTKRCQLFKVNEKDKAQIIQDFKVSQKDAVLALEQTGNVEDALAWLSRSQQDRIFISKPEIVKEKQMQQGNMMSVSMLELPDTTNKLARILLHVNRGVYILGYSPKQISQFVLKTHNQLVNVSDFKRQLSFDQIDTRSWFNGQNHKVLSILDGSIQPQPVEFIFREADKRFFACTSTSPNEPVTKSQIQIDFHKLYDFDNVIRIQGKQPIAGLVNLDSVTRTVQGELIHDQIVKESKSHVFINPKSRQLYSRLPSKSSKNIKVSALIREQNFTISPCSLEKSDFIPLLIQKGPPGCNLQYPICSILYPKSVFLANYPHQIKFKSLHSNYMNITSVVMERLNKSKQTNQAKGGYIYFEAQNGVQSKKYHFVLSEKEQRKQVKIQEKGFWKFMIIEPVFRQEEGKRTSPYEIGFVGAKGSTIEEDVYRSLALQILKNSLEMQVNFSISRFVETSNKMVDIQLKVSGLQISQSDLLNKIKPLNSIKSLISCQFILQEQAPQSKKSLKAEKIKNIESLEIKEVIELYLKKQNRISIIKEITKKKKFSFKDWDKVSIRKFMDITFMNADTIKPGTFTNLFDKIIECPEGKNYLVEHTQDLGKCYIAYPENYLPYLMNKIEPLQHRQNLKDLMKNLHKFRSDQYEPVRKLKIPYLLFQQDFYSKQYLSSIENMQKQSSFSTEQTKLEVYEEYQVIPCQFSVIKDELSRKILVKLQNGVHSVRQLVLRLDRTEISSRINFKVLAYNNANQRMQIASQGRIEEHQWMQVSGSSSRESMKNMFGKRCSNLNGLGLTLQAQPQTEYLQIQLIFNETGLVANDLDSASVPFIDIVPQLYGQKVDTQTRPSECIRMFQKYFTFTQKESFLLSKIELGVNCLSKYSINKENEFQYLYFRPSIEKVHLLKKNIRELLENGDYFGAIPYHKKLVSSYKQLSKKPGLDYVYTLLLHTLEQIFQHKIKIDEDLCGQIYEQIITREVGPIRIAAFKAASHSIKYLVKSLPYLQDQNYMPSLQQTTFDQKQIEPILDLENTQLCFSLNKLVVDSIPYKNDWGCFAAKICRQVTEMYDQTILYILKSNELWLNSVQLIKFFNCSVPENYFRNVFLSNVPSQNLQKFITLSKKNGFLQRLDLLINKLIEIHSGKANDKDNDSTKKGTVSLDIISIMLEQKEVKWHHLYRMIELCPEAEDFILNQYLQVALDKPAQLAQCYPEILNHAAKSPKHAENLASFLSKLFASNRSAFKRAILNLSTSETGEMHSDMRQVITFYLYQECNFGGCQGSKILTEDQVINLYVAQFLLSKIQSVQNNGSDSAQEEVLIEWYFCNNSYELNESNPVNTFPGTATMKIISNKVLNLLKSTQIKKILKVFDRLIQEIQKQSIPLSTKHLYVNQINTGVKQLLGKSINPKSLGEVLLENGTDSKMLAKIFQTLKKNSPSSSAQNSKVHWIKCDQVDITSNFIAVTTTQQKIKDWEANRNGSKSSLFKVSAANRKITLKSSVAEPATLSKFLIGFQVIDNNQKNNIAPSRVQLYGGQNQSSLSKLCELKQIRDQHFESFNVRVFGINFNSMSSRKSIWPINFLEVRLAEPMLTSISQVFENTQKTKKNGQYSVSFLSMRAYQSQPQNDPQYNQIYMTMLSFLSDPSYESILVQVLSSKYYQANSTSILRTLNTMLPNEEIQNLLIAFNSQNIDILGSVLEEAKPNMSLVNILISKNPSSQNINKLLEFFLKSKQAKNYSQTANILIEAIKIYSYSKSAIMINFDITQLINAYEKRSFINQQDFLKVLSCMLTSPKIFKLDYQQLLQQFWKSENRSLYFILIGTTISYYTQTLDRFLESGKTKIVADQLLALLSDKNTSASPSSIYNHIFLLSSLSTHKAHKEFLISNKIPIQIVNLLRSEETLISKQHSASMPYLILLFQQTCISSECQVRFSQILIELMVKLSQVAAAHHSFFIHEFFFPLINAFHGMPVKFVWKSSSGDVFKQATHSLNQKPIKCRQTGIQIQGKFYELISEQNIVSSDLLTNENKELVVIKKNQEKRIAAKILNKVCTIDGKAVPFELSDGKLVIKGGVEQISLDFKQKQQQEYQLYRENTADLVNLLTNQTLINLKNTGIFGQKYLNTIPVQDSTFERIYYIPSEMNLAEVLKQVNICGYRLNEQCVKSCKIQKFIDSTEQSIELPMDKCLSDLFEQKQQHLITLEMNPQGLFRNTSIEKIHKSPIHAPIFIPQQTIFKAFEKQEGLLEMIKVLKTCVKNWNNKVQSQVWEQYLNELESYSVFPVFSSIYMNKQENVKLLFDILSGLPDKQDSAKWILIQKNSVKYLYDIIKDVFEVEGQKAKQIRKYAVENNFYKTMLDRLHLVSKQTKRCKVTTEDEEEQTLDIPAQIEKKNSEEQYKLKVIKKKGIGYGTDSSTNQKWDISGQEQSKKQIATQVLGLLTILEKFIDHKDFQIPAILIEQSFESALLPNLESSLRGGSLLEISKSADLFKGQLSLIKAFTRKRAMTPLLMSIPKDYEPKQHQSIEELLKILEGTSRIFISCLTGSASQKLSEQIAKGIIETYQLVKEAISSYNVDNVDEDAQKKIMQLPLAKKYPILLKDLRFDYVDMKDKNGKISKHHYASNFTPNHKSPATKTIRLAQQLADISHALPVEHTNAIYVRCDKERVDFMQALIMGSNGTPYGHGAYLFDIYFDDTYPNNPPKVNLTTTGSGSIRFNPNLYNCGKVCLSLLGTWRGSAMENWDAKISTLLQILLSIQSIIMSEQVYFNQPGFEHEQGTIEGEKKNQAYANIVRHGNIKFAMTDNLKNPPKGFEHVIKRHFYLKKDEIMENCRKWLKFAEKRQASYTGLVSDHNNNWCNQFKKSKTQYKTSLQKAIRQLEAQLNKLTEPTSKDLKPLDSQSPKKQKAKKVTVQSKDQDIEGVDVTYDKTETSNFKELDINDDKVKDRWSRYIGAMGIEAVSKQAKASIALVGLGAVGVEIAKNLILSGCKKISIKDDRNSKVTDLAGQFFLDEQDVGKNIVESCLYKLQELNHYVRVEKLNLEISEGSDLSLLDQYDVVILTEQPLDIQKFIGNYCHEKSIKFIVCDCYGPFGQHFNDFGKDFEVIDKNGEQTVEVMIQDITIAEKGIVTLLKGQRHPYEDGEAVRITGVKGMLDGQKSINETIHKIRVLSPGSFEIGDTTGYSEYIGDGLARNMKLPIKVEFKSFQESVKLCNIDDNLAFYDFQKGGNSIIVQKCILVLSKYRKLNQQRFPKPWNWEDGEEFFKLFKEDYSDEMKPAQANLVRQFAYTCSGTFAPLCAFYGGLTAQQTFKAITGKYMPVNQYFITEFSEVIPALPQQTEEAKRFVEEQVKYAENQHHRSEGLRRIVGSDVYDLIEKCRVFLIGSGAIGCQLLKNFAMINLATSKKDKEGEIIVTDPDHIQQSNLNRQFLFRQKHLRKPKSVTAAAAVAQMNKLLKGKIRAKLDRVCESTNDIYSNQFFESLSIVANALDNVKARQYVDQRCVENKVALLESGTLSSKGHVQVIIPYQTQSYGSKNDPAEDGQIPHCTLKMFPQETLHCVQWARDIFGKTFTLDPKALSKLVEGWKTYTPSSADLAILKTSAKMIQNRPRSFDQAVLIATNKFFEHFRNDICQLLYTYPLDAKTKDGKPFWKLPKRPPAPVEEIQPENPLHNSFITSYAVLLCKIFNIKHPIDFRTRECREKTALQASKIKVEKFVPSDKLAKEMTQTVDNDEKDEEKKEDLEQSEEKTENKQELNDENQLYSIIKKGIQESQLNGEQIKVTAQEFQKDDDQNGHIDLIHSMANLRAKNYKLDQMDWMTVKLKAGRITPALSTTTSCVAALQTIELIKYLKKCKLDKMRNTFINLAVPMIQAGQPGEVEKIKIHEELTTNVWQRWEIGPIKVETVSLGQLIKLVNQKYKIDVKILSILQGGQIYSDLVLGLESKKADKEKQLGKTVKDHLLNQLAAQDIKKFVDMTLVFSVNEQLAQHVPTLRVHFEAN